MFLFSLKDLKTFPLLPPCCSYVYCTWEESMFSSSCEVSTSSGYVSPVCETSFQWRSRNNGAHHVSRSWMVYSACPSGDGNWFWEFITTEAEGRRELALIGGCPPRQEEERGSMICTWKLGRTSRPVCSSRGCSAASNCQFQLLVFSLFKRKKSSSLSSRMASRATTLAYPCCLSVYNCVLASKHY
jgi:hypothetical protein